jgi:uncharacterized membrane protein YedE/YeeE
MRVCRTCGRPMDVKEGTVRKNGFWSPYIAGMFLGLTLLAVFTIAGRGLGASGAFSLVSGVGLHAVAPGYANNLKYFSQYLDSPSPLMNWNLFLIVGVFLGGLAGSLFFGNFKVLFDRGKSMSMERRLLTAFFGGVLIGFASRLARGCTSGVALTGGAQLALSGWVFVIAMFAAGFLFAAIFRRFWS